MLLHNLFLYMFFPRCAFTLFAHFFFNCSNETHISSHEQHTFHMAKFMWIAKCYEILMMIPYGDGLLQNPGLRGTCSVSDMHWSACFPAQCAFLVPLGHATQAMLFSALLAVDKDDSRTHQTGHLWETLMWLWTCWELIWGMHQLTAMCLGQAHLWQ